MKFLEDRPIWMQIEAEIRRRILAREWAQGARIASARELAAELAVNPNTVMRAYDLLQEAGVLESRRGVGSFVAEGARARVLIEERRIFNEVELPALRRRMKMLEIKELKIYENEQ